MSRADKLIKKDEQAMATNLKKKPFNINPGDMVTLTLVDNESRGKVVKFQQTNKKDVILVTIELPSKK